jgi:predicted DNA-binding transcriptional regulator AlpA
MGATLPQTGFLRIHHIIGDAKKGIIGIFPVSRSSWYEGIKAGKYPPPVNLGGGRSVAWKVEDIRALLDSQNRVA